MHSRLVLVTLLFYCDFAAALRFPLMGDQVMTPRRATSGDGSSLSRRRLGNSLERRQEVEQRRQDLLEKRNSGELDERGLFDWIGNVASTVGGYVQNAAKSLPSLFDGSSNCYVKGFPTFGSGCASKATPYFRQGSAGISAEESAYITSKKAASIASFTKWLNNMNIPGMPSPSSSNFPKVAVTFSGGGLRALLSGAGVFDGLDSRSTTAKPNLNDGKPTLNGLLDWATYMTGLSGGSWLIGASAQNNFATIDSLRANIWKRPQLIPDLTDFGFSYASMATDYARKYADFPDLISLVDIWSWFIGYGIVSRGQSPAKTLFSDVQTKSNWASFRMPFPIVTICQQASGGYQNAFDQNVPIYESTPLDFGSWSSSLGFIKANMMSTIFSSASTTYKCMTNFALTQWILGASSCVMPGAGPNIDSSQAGMLAWLQTANKSPYIKVALAAISSITGDLNQYVNGGYTDVKAMYQSLLNKGLLTANMYNPYKYATNGKVAGNILDPDGPVLRLDDGALNLQNLPVVPLLFRGVDAIIANDNSGDTTDMWPNGTALYATMQWARRNGLQFPNVPSPDESVARGLNKRPVFYGCNSTTGPLIVYVPAAAGINGANGVVNIDTVTLEVDQNVVPTFINNGIANIIRPSNTLAGQVSPSNWPQCVACAVMARQLAKLGNGTLPATCQTCFSTLCYS